jgi:hypothetical protein
VWSLQQHRHKPFLGDDGIVDNLVMTPAQPPGRRRSADTVATILLLIGHALMVLFTLFGVVVAVIAQDDLKSRCRWHDLDCTNPWIEVAARIAGLGGGLLFILDLVFAITWMLKRRLAFYVPLLGCVGQAVVFAATVVVLRR